MDTLYLSGLTRIFDPETVSCLVRDLAVTPPQAWHVENGLRVKLMEASVEGPLDETETLPPAPSRSEEVPEDLFGEEDTVGSEEKSRGPADQEDSGAGEPPAAVTGIDDYEIGSDVAGGQPAPAGGRSAPSPVEPRAPGKPVRVTKPQRKAPTAAARKVEERGLDLLVEYVLEPQGIRISDQRLRPGVGADLYCSDEVFRELKTFGGRATDRIKLSKHQQARALVSEDHYELVVVEDVWSEPVITIIPSPMKHLLWRATGDVEVVDWRERSSSFRVIRLRQRTVGPHEPSD
jgi:hypothetical protein